MWSSRPVLYLLKGEDPQLIDIEYLRTILDTGIIQMTRRYSTNLST